MSKPSALMKPTAPHRPRVALMRPWAAAIRAGAEPAGALQVLAEFAEDPAVAAQAQLQAQQLTQGVPLGTVLAQGLSQPAAALLEQATQQQRLGDALEMLANDMERHQSLRFGWWMVGFPLFLAGISIAIAVFFGVLILPPVAEMYHGFGATLPIPTRLILFLSQPLGLGVLLLLGALVVGGWFACRRLRHRAPQRLLPLDRLWLNLPWCGRYLRLALNHRLLGALADATRLQLPLGLTLQHLACTADNQVQAGQLAQAALELGEGQAEAAEALRAAASLPRSIRGCAALAQVGADLPSLLGALGEEAGPRADLARHQLERATFYACYLVIGLWVALLVIGMYLPIFSLSAAV